LVTAEWGTTLNGWVGEAEQEWALCFSSFTDDTRTPAVFHDQCDQYDATLTVVHNELGFTFGGFVRSALLSRLSCVRTLSLKLLPLGHGFVG
jgi:hypothetical protein